VSHKGTVGRVALAPPDAELFVCSPQTTLWRVLDEDRLDRGFLFAQLRSPWLHGQFRRVMHESDMAPYVSLSSQRRFKVLLPPIDVQRRIARVISALDDKIESNRRLCKLLDAVCQAEFDRLTSLATSGEHRIGDICDINSRSWTGANAPEWIDYIDISSTAEREILTVQRLLYTDAPSRARRIVRTNDTIVSLVRPERRAMAFIHEASPELTASTGFAVVTPSRASPTFVYRAVTSDRCIDRLTAEATGSAYPATNASVLGDVRVAMPSDSGAEFERFARPLESRIAAARTESRSLAAIRDALLPKLVSGQIRVPLSDDSAGQVGAAIEALA